VDSSNHGRKDLDSSNHGIPIARTEAVEWLGGLVSGVLQTARSTVLVQGVIYSSGDICFFFK
jgi:hypothetical protein